MDDDISAYKGKKTRPEFSRFLLGLKDGRFDVVMATANDRFTRGSASELEAPQMMCVQAKAVIHTVPAGVQNPATPMIRALLEIQDTLGGLEGGIRVERQLQANQDVIFSGKPLAGRPPFGFVVERGRVVGINESEAAQIRAAAQAVLDGASLYSIAKGWGRPPKSVRGTLLHPRNAGYLTYKGETVNQDQPATLDSETFDAVTELLTNLSRVPKRGPKEGALLSTIMRCRCGAGMTYVTAHYMYKCSSRAGDKTVRHQTVGAEDAEAAVLTAVLCLVATTILDEPKNSADLQRIGADLAENTRQQNAVTDLLMDPDIQDTSRPKARLLMLERARALLVDQRAAIQIAKAHGSAFEQFWDYSRAPLGGWSDLVEKDLAFQSWSQLLMEQKREIIRAKLNIAIADGRGPGRVHVTRRYSPSKVCKTVQQPLPVAWQYLLERGR